MLETRLTSCESMPGTLPAVSNEENQPHQEHSQEKTGNDERKGQSFDTAGA
jgi:hypothetical protein